MYIYIYREQNHTTNIVSHIDDIRGQHLVITTPIFCVLCTHTEHLLMTLCMPQDSFSLSFVCSSHLIAHQPSAGGIEQQKKKKKKKRTVVVDWFYTCCYCFVHENE
jgi:hypothetical protein